MNELETNKAELLKNQLALEAKFKAAMEAKRAELLGLIVIVAGVDTNYHPAIVTSVTDFKDESATVNLTVFPDGRGPSFIVGVTLYEDQVAAWEAVVAIVPAKVYAYKVGDRKVHEPIPPKAVEPAPVKK